MKKILFVASEAVPFIKTGGLADVVGALPKCFDKNEYDVRVIIPKYMCMKQEWKEKLEYITVDFVRRIPVDIFEKWYADQDIYRKVTHIPTAEEMENDYICLQDAADMLGISREKLAKIARCEEIGRLLNSTICNNKRWITRKSFQLFLNAQNVYHITDDGDRQEESQVLQEKETLSLMVKEYISRQDAAELAGVNVSTVTKWMQSGEFQCIGAGKVLRIHRQQFLNWLNEHREGVV